MVLHRDYTMSSMFVLALGMVDVPGQHAHHEVQQPHVPDKQHGQNNGVRCEDSSRAASQRSATISVRSGLPMFLPNL